MRRRRKGVGSITTPLSRPFYGLRKSPEKVLGSEPLLSRFLTTKLSKSLNAHQQLCDELVQGYDGWAG